MLLNFQKQFALPVWRGKKSQTIRAKGKRLHVPKVGEIAYCYTGLRTKSTQLLGQFTICSVEELHMEIGAGILACPLLDGAPVSENEWFHLALADGFPNSEAMSRWFMANHEPGAFNGWVIQWAWNPAGIGPRPYGCELMDGAKGGAA